MIDSTLITDPYIYLEDNVLSEVRCKEIINKFNNDKHYQGITTGGVDLDVKNSTDLHLSKTEQDWSEEDALFSKIVGTGHENYYAHLNKVSNCLLYTSPSPRDDT